MGQGVGWGGERKESRERMRKSGRHRRESSEPCSARSLLSAQLAAERPEQEETRRLTVALEREFWGKPSAPGQQEPGMGTRVLGSVPGIFSHWHPKASMGQERRVVF